MVYGEAGRFDLEYYYKKIIIHFWGSIACDNKKTILYYVQPTQRKCT